METNNKEKEMRVSKVHVQDMLESLEVCQRIISRLKDNDVDTHSLITAANQLMHVSSECRELVGAARFEYNQKRGI